MKAMLPVVLLTVCWTNQIWAAGSEDFGEECINEQNYQDWPGMMPFLNVQTRVYHMEVNGNERFYYQGDTEALNDALQKFSAVKADVHEVLLQPGPGVVHSFHRTQTIPYNWNVHIVGGVSRHMTTLDQGDKIWSQSPTMTICVGEAIDLTKLKIPEGVSVVDLDDMSRRYRQALVSKDKTVRGWGAGQLAYLDPYDADNLAAIAKLLKDEDDWVRRNAIGAVATFGKRAESVLPMLREMLGTQDKQLKTQIKKTLAEIEQSQDTTMAAQQQRFVRQKIHKFCDSRKEQSPKSPGLE